MVWSGQEGLAEEPLRLSEKPLWANLSIKNASQGNQQGKNVCSGLGAELIVLWVLQVLSHLR